VQARVHRHASGQGFDKELGDLNAAEPPPGPRPPRPKPRHGPWQETALGRRRACGPCRCRRQEAALGHDEPAAGPADDDDLPGFSATAGKSPFDDEPVAPSTRTDVDDDGGSFSASLDAASGHEAKIGGEDDFLNSLGGASLDAPAKDAGAAKKKKLIILGVSLAVVAALVAALFVFKPWTKMNIPFLGSLSGEKQGEEKIDKVKDIALRNVRQYYIPNEKAGNVFVVEGKAVNNFATPKERIKVEITLFDEKGQVLASKQLLCGNTLSQFQLQVQSEEEINASLSSEVGILTSNTFLKTGMDTPFMAVFFKPPDAVKEFGVKVIDALDPK
jgi:hypothetical protein